MRYIDFRDSILEELEGSAGGLTWKELRERLELPYIRPCQEWIGRMERDNGLVRSPGPGRALLWHLDVKADEVKN